MSKEDLYLAFVERIGETYDNKFIYRFDFTEAPEIVWGEGWNVVPCSIMPVMNPDPTTISATARLVTEKDFNLAKENNCFSMQDCIDGIISILFTDPRDKEELILNFGDKFNEVENKLSARGLELVEFEETHQDKENQIVDDTLEMLDNINNDEDDE